MGRLLTFILLMGVSLNSFSAYAPPGIPAVQLGSGLDVGPSKVIAGGALSSVIPLNFSSVGPTAGDYYRLIKMGQQSVSSENYRVTLGKTLYCSGVYFAVGSTSLGILFGYGTTPVTNDNNTSPSGEILYGTATSPTMVVGNAVDSKYSFISIPMSFPSQSYPFVKVIAGTTGFYGQLLCEEQ